MVFAGLWSGLLAMLTLILHPMLAEMDGSGFARFLGAFPVSARPTAVRTKRACEGCSASATRATIGAASIPRTSA